jgi:hypothetical protein
VTAYQWEVVPTALEWVFSSIATRTYSSTTAAKVDAKYASLLHHGLPAQAVALRARMREQSWPTYANHCEGGVRPRTEC